MSESEGQGQSPLQPGYPQRGGQPGYPPQGGQPGFPPQGGQPGYPQQPAPGYPPQGGQPGYPQQPPPGYPPQGGQPVHPQQPPPGYPPQGYVPQPGQGYPPQGGQPGYPPQGGQPEYPPQGGQPGYRPQGGQPGYPPQGPGNPPPGYRPPGPATPPKKKSPLLLIGIVVAAVVALVAIGGIVIGLTSGSKDVPDTTITPDPQTPPPDEPSSDPSSSPSAGSSSEPSSGSTPGGNGQPGSGLDIGHGVTLVPAAGWDVKKQTADLAQLSDGDNVFIGQTAELDASANPGQVCTAWHKQLAQGEGGGKFATPKVADVGTDKLKAATCSAQVTASSGQGSSELLLVTVVSVRSSDGVTVLGTVAFTASSDQDQLQKDFTAMSNSMLQTQAAG